MKYTNLGRDDRAAMLEDLRGMPAFLHEVFAGLTADQAAAQPEPGSFSPAEHCWHLADLEREGFGARIARLRTETNPLLPDFDGGRLAIERDYRSRSLEEGLAAFAAERAANLATLARVDDAEWSRGGTQEGVGAVALCDLPAMMADHDRAHRREIEDWSRQAR